MQPTLDVLDIVVTDLGAAIGFYRLLGLEFVRDQYMPDDHAELTAAGVTGLQEPFDAPWGMRYATVADPSGNGVDLYANLPADPTH